MASPSPTPPSLSPTPHPTLLLPPPQPQSKRDKRRNALSEKLNLLTRSFHNPTNPRIREQHYRAQIASLQVDMQLIQRADVSGRDMRLMDDSCETIQREVDAVLANMGVRVSDVNSEGIQGRWYSDFLRDVNDSMEERDTQLTLLFVCNPPPLRRSRHPIVFLLLLCFALLIQPSNKSEFASYESRIDRCAAHSFAYPRARGTPISRLHHLAAPHATTEGPAQETCDGKRTFIVVGQRALFPGDRCQSHRHLRVERTPPPSFTLWFGYWNWFAETSWGYPL